MRDWAMERLLTFALIVMKRAREDRHWDDVSYWEPTGFGGHTIAQVEKLLEAKGKD